VITLDQQFADSLSKYLSHKYNVKVPNIRITRVPTRGMYVNNVIDTIFLDPSADVEVALHEIGHHIFALKGVKFDTIDAEEVAANRFAAQEAAELGMPLHPRNTYLVKFNTTGSAEKLFREIYARRRDLGIDIKEYKVEGDQLFIKLSSSHPAEYDVNHCVKYFSPIIWAIMGLAAILGIGIISYNVSQTYPEITKWVGMIIPIAALGVASYVAVSLLK
jgi:hypothetical protein